MKNNEYKVAYIEEEIENMFSFYLLLEQPYGYWSRCHVLVAALRWIYRRNGRCESNNGEEGMIVNETKPSPSTTITLHLKNWYSSSVPIYSLSLQKIVDQAEIDQKENGSWESSIYSFH